MIMVAKIATLLNILFIVSPLFKFICDDERLTKECYLYVTCDYKYYKQHIFLNIEKRKYIRLVTSMLKA